jgi:hypothetical protein
MFFQKPESLFALSTRVYIDHCPEDRFPMPTIYVFSETEDNQIANLQSAILALDQEATKSILLCNGETEHGCVGFAYCTKMLIQAGVFLEAILSLDIPLSVNVNTLVESQYLVRLAKKQGWKNILITAPSFHELRAFVTTVSVAQREYPQLSIWPYCGLASSWQQEVNHSQGTLRAKRKDLIFHEYERLIRYHENGDLISCEEVLKYMDRRDLGELG